MFANQDGYCEKNASEIKRVIVSMAIESSLLHSHFYKYSHSHSHLHPNKMPKVNLTLAPHPSKEHADLIARLDVMQQSLKDMDFKIGCVVKGNADALEVLDTLIGTSDNALEIAPASAPTSAPTATSSDINQEVYNRLFVSKALSTLSAANDSKSSWNAEIHFNRSPNKELTLALMAYLKSKFAADGLRPSKIHGSIYTNFCGRRSAEQKLPSALDAGRSRSRRASRATTNFDCHELAYSICKVDIDILMEKNCEGLINKTAMSESESEDEIPEVSDNHYNQFLGHVDKAMLRCLSLNVRQIVKKTFGRDTDLAVPSQLKRSLPQWAFRDEL
ncbi:hypothetical protein PHYBLDRAFT_168966 [Phycomyces blakesleeanus NRRL 1555(-)]|uniref:Uncharacterized protein n=1 Tax=Phycomyces blakesleeanus (strain ATCC 8743b / DSM 1359 / FGSC 10004 / NBRC 33097 / NRRL 1555) TaxID=763407 RepID=A0A162U6E1_PHYB8|nr:hypothetical protein PHYBLDRAFT_168966 [Phycomyces blakesleeanus NRRL 1555(-)]OAD72703.1 hypothetical protein PHYBLDRAFT_168966 [Phycomyces blakesleeanus NRRL 1555(-)]|eukprot:XP_018290743.1 hypothetical protein PHYBLDRAFT_168966 [Phycomyces blakesleeanus NRRL 1555(-)]